MRRSPTGAWSRSECAEAPHPRALYIHIPFCARRCSYCDFAIAVPRDGVPIAAYLDALETEARLHPVNGPLRTVYAGGGTPSALAGGALDRFFSILRAAYSLADGCEFSMECNPEDVDSPFARSLARGGVNRVSLGVQSFSPAGLRVLGRRHGPADVRRAVLALRDAGIRRINLDIIVGWPGQTLESLGEDLRTATSLEPDHLSVYALSIEPGTALDRASRMGRFPTLTEERELELLHCAWSHLEAAGFRRYEVSNFARPGARCRHNMVYWRNRPYLGLGPSAVSFVGGERRKNEPDLRTWVERLRAGLGVVVERETLPESEAVRETVMLGLRTRAGVDPRWLRARHGRGLESLDQSALARLLAAGVLEDARGRVRLTRRGFDVADAVAAELL